LHFIRVIVIVLESVIIIDEEIVQLEVIVTVIVILIEGLVIEIVLYISLFRQRDSQTSSLTH